MNTTSDDVKYWFNKLTKLAYNEQRLDQSLKSLKTIHYKNVNSLLYYYDEYQKRVKEVNRCLSQTEKLTVREKKEILFKGLANWMKKELLRMPDEYSMLRKIERLEEIKNIEKQIKKKSSYEERLTKTPKKKNSAHFIRLIHIRMVNAECRSEIIPQRTTQPMKKA